VAGWSLDSPLRLHALDEVDVYPGAPADAFAVYVRLVARFLDVPTALVTFVRDDCQFFPAAVGLEEPWATRRQTPLSLSFCRLVVTTDEDLVVTDATSDARVRDNVAVSELGIHAYLGVPLRAPGGEPLGALCAVDNRPRAWSAADLATMHDIADAVTTTIALRTSEHRRARLAADASHELRTPLTRLRFELDDLAHSASVDAAVARLREVNEAVDSMARAVSRDRMRGIDVDLVSVCHDVVSQRDLAAAPVLIAGTSTVVVHSLRAIVHHVVALLVGAFAEQPLAIIVGGDDDTGRIEIHTAAAPADPSVIAPIRRLLGEQLGGRLIERPTPDIAFEIVLPRS
jgi:signal transduction histidine kinase